jgi:hypothetical protein
MGTGPLSGDAELESHSLAQELAFAIEHESLPRMLRNLLATALDGLRAARQGGAAPDLVIARFAVAEWRRWRTESRG